jgi:CheY-like chemotaxis protein
MPFPPDPMTPPLPDAALRLPLQGLTLLIVDDSRYACDALRLILSRAGARLRRAETLESGRLHLRRYRPDLAIVDLGLPDGRGEDLIADLARRGLPVLGLSGDPAGREAALAAGALTFLEKPVLSVMGLVHLVRQLATGATDLGDEGPCPPSADPGALRDDLLRAVDLIQTRGDPTYALSFLQGLARAAGDVALETAVRASTTPFDRAKLARMIEDRLSRLSPLGWPPPDPGPAFSLRPAPDHSWPGPDG